MRTAEQKIQEFIQDYKRSRVIIETSVKAVLKRAVEYEDIYNKAFYEFSKSEIMCMYIDAHAISVTSIHNWNLILKHAARWFLYKNGTELTNEYENITKEDLRPCVDINKKDKRIIDREQLDVMQNELLNAVDKAILELLFLGVTGEWMRELTYLEPEQVSKQDMCIYFRTGKIVPIDDRAYELITAAFEETEMMSYGEVINISQVQGTGIYKMRCNTLYTNDNSKDENDAERRGRWLQRRLMIMNSYLDVSMTPKSLNASGFLHYLKINMQQSGFSDYKMYLKTEDGKRFAERYGFKSKRYVSIIDEKFRRYL